MPRNSRNRCDTRVAGVAALVALLTAAVACGPDLGEDGAAPPALSLADRAEATAERMADADIVDIPVSFAVDNVNRSAVPCNTDGATHEIRGHLTAPATLLDDTDPDVTLYQHGMAAGEWYWRLDLPGYHHAEEMARLGHASLTLDRLGYGDSDRPSGLDMCLGGHADMTDQIVTHLRAGSYQADDLPAGTSLPEFDSVVVAGHHNGGQIALITAYSFDNVDGLVLMGWGGTGLTDEANARFFGGLAACMQGGVPADAPPGPPQDTDAATAGYTYVDVGRSAFTTGNLHDAADEVVALTADQQSRTPCGDLASQLEALSIDLHHLDEVAVPTALVYGDEDTRVTDGPDFAQLLTGAPDVELVTVPDAGHFMVLEPGVDAARASLTSWLDSHGLG